MSDLDLKADDGEPTYSRQYNKNPRSRRPEHFGDKRAGRSENVTSVAPYALGGDDYKSACRDVKGVPVSFRVNGEWITPEDQNEI